MPLRILADENMPRKVVEVIRHRGHDVAWGRRDAPGANDEAVLARAQAEGRVILTFDKDFGDLAFRQRLPADSGIILFRLGKTSVREAIGVVLSTLELRSNWTGHFTVVDQRGVRVTPLPAQEH